MRETYELKAPSHVDLIFLGDEDVDEQLRLKEDTIFRLKQQISNMQQRIEDLTTENEDLKKAQLSSPTIKEEGMCIAHASCYGSLYFAI